MKLGFYKTCFRITAVGNVLAAIGALASMESHLAFFYGAVETNPVFRVYHYGFWVFVLVLGIAYWELSKRPLELGIIALVGAVGKLAMVGLWIHLYFSGHATAFIWSGIAYDAFFGIVMAIFFFTTWGKDGND